MGKTYLLWIAAILVLILVSPKDAARLITGRLVTAGIVSQTGKSNQMVAEKLSEFSESYDIGALQLSPDGTLLATGPLAFGREAHLWNIKGSRILAHVLPYGTTPSIGSTLSFNADGSRLAFAHGWSGANSGKEVVRIFDTRTGETVHAITEPNGAGVEMAVSYFDDGRYLARLVNPPRQSGGDELVIHRTDTWETVWSALTLEFVARAIAIGPGQSVGAVGGVTYLPGDGLAVRPQIVVLDIANRRVARLIDRVFPDNNEVRAVAISADGRTLAAGGRVGGTNVGPNAIAIYEIQTGKLEASESAQVANVSGLAYTADGRYLIEGSIDNGVHIWDAQHTKRLQTISGDWRYVAVSRDSRILAIASRDHIQIWNLR